MGLNRIVIVTPAYCEKVGGAVVLHKLCDILRKQGYDASLYPFVTCFQLSDLNCYNGIVQLLKQFLRVRLSRLFNSFALNHSFDTPMFRGNLSSLKDEKTIVVYPETVNGNPLCAKNVVRWLLHQPGFHTGQICFGRCDLLVKFNSAIKDIQLDGVSIAKQELKVIHYPIEHYFKPLKEVDRKGVAVCIRKGAGKKFVHDDQAILIDDLPHQAVGEVLRNVKYFVSYDTYTAYSLFAVLCGCISIVVPDENQTEEQWYPDVQDRWGIAYGYDKIPFAEQTAELQVKRIRQQIQAVEGNVSKSFTEIETFFRKS